MKIIFVAVLGWLLIIFSPDFSHGQDGSGMMIDCNNCTGCTGGMDGNGTCICEDDLAFNGEYCEREEKPPNDGLNGGEIAGIVVGSCAGVAIIGGGAYYGYQSANSKKNRVKTIQPKKIENQDGDETANEHYRTSAA